jgi:hypothetical protein
MYRYFCAIYVALFSVLAVAGAMASFGATADGQFVLAIVFTVLTAVLVHWVWFAYDNFRATL